MKIIKAIPNWIYAPVLIILVIVDAIGIGAEEIVKKIKFAQVSESYETLMALFPLLRSASEKYLMLFIVLTLIVLAAFLLKLFYKEQLYVLEHFSFTEGVCGLGVQTKKNYWVKTDTLNQAASFEDGIPSAQALVDIDEKIKNIQQKAGKGNVGYYGVAHIPFAFLAGYDFGDQSKIHIFHRKRHNDEVFEELSEGANYDLRFDIEEKQKTKRSNELIVAVSTSLEITEDEIKRSFGSDKHIVMLKLNNQGYDQLDKYESVERASNEAWASIRKYSKQYAIRKIHLLIAASVGFAFYMGRKCSAQIDPQVIVYHYQSGQYRWGISVNGEDHAKHIIEIKESHDEDA
jgi:hypothetical protein